MVNQYMILFFYLKTWTDSRSYTDNGKPVHGMFIFT
jgi:hypothetical protein